MTVFCTLPFETPIRSYKNRVKTEFSSFVIAHFPLKMNGTIQRNFRMKQKGWNTPENSRNPIIQVLEGLTQGHPDRITQRQHSTNNTGTWPEITSLIILLQSKICFSLQCSTIWLDLPCWAEYQWCQTWVYPLCSSRIGKAIGTQGGSAGSPLKSSMLP